MYTDVVDLRDFYETGLGQVARRMIRRRIRLLWPDVSGQVVLGLGFAAPYLRPFRGEAEAVFAAMPAEQGAMAWPPEGPGLVTLCEGEELPFPDMSVDRVLLIHCLESADDLRTLLREAWRVLAGGGRLLAVVPNRRGIWARTDTTPFGVGSPYSGSQLSRTLRDNMFTPLRMARAIYIPPIRSRVFLKSAAAWESVGERLFKTFSGVVMIEASKQIYAPAQLRKAPKRRRLLVPAPVRAFPTPFGPGATERPVAACIRAGEPAGS